MNSSTNGHRRPLSAEELGEFLKESIGRARNAMRQAHDQDISLRKRLGALGFPPDEREYISKIYWEFMNTKRPASFDKDKALDLVIALAAIGSQVGYDELENDDLDVMGWEPLDV